MITIEVPGPPRGKGRPRFRLATGRTYTDEKTADYEGDVKGAGMRAMVGAAPLDGPLTVHIRALMSIPKSGTKAVQKGRRGGWIRPTTKPDLDNIAKTIDGLNGIVWNDDAQIVWLLVEKEYDERPRMIITVEEWNAL